MHGRIADLVRIECVAQALAGRSALLEPVALCPPALWLRDAVRIAGGGPLQIGAQDCAPVSDGPHTGDHSAGMLAEAGARLVLVGHSERRSAHGETDAQVRLKAEAARAAGLTPVICIGETAADREAGRALEVVAAQACGSAPPSERAVALAYEPVWAIGAGRTPSVGEIAAMHAYIRERLGACGFRDIRILYGGSVKPANAAELLAAPGVDGLLVGGASFDPQAFLRIVAASDAQSRQGSAKPA